MPKLMILTACERVIVDRATSLPSLINIFQRMNIQLQDAPLVENAVAATKWSVFSLWAHTPEERDVEYTQRLEIISPSGAKYAELSTKFKITDADDLQSKNHLDVLGLPISTEGFIKIRVWLEGVADTTGEYQFLVKHNPKVKNETEPATANR